MRFSPFDGCERVNQLYECSGEETCTFLIRYTNPLIHVYQKEKIAGKVASGNKS
jgi:hypothetical protein